MALKLGEEMRGFDVKLPREHARSNSSSWRSSAVARPLLWRRNDFTSTPTAAFGAALAAHLVEEIRGEHVLLLVLLRMSR